MPTGIFFRGVTFSLGRNRGFVQITGAFQLRGPAAAELTAWLAGLPGCLTGCLAAWLAGWLAGWLPDFLASWLLGWLTGWLAALIPFSMRLFVLRQAKLPKQIQQTMMTERPSRIQNCFGAQPYKTIVFLANGIWVGRAYAGLGQDGSA